MLSLDRPVVGPDVKSSVKQQEVKSMGCSQKAFRYHVTASCRKPSARVKGYVNLWEDNIFCYSVRQATSQCLYFLPSSEVSPQDTMPDDVDKAAYVHDRFTSRSEMGSSHASIRQ